MVKMLIVKPFFVVSDRVLPDIIKLCLSRVVRGGGEERACRYKMECPIPSDDVLLILWKTAEGSQNVS